MMNPKFIFGDDVRVVSGHLKDKTGFVWGSDEGDGWLLIAFDDEIEDEHIHESNLEKIIQTGEKNDQTTLFNG